MKIITPYVEEGDWIRIQGYQPTDLSSHRVTIGGEDLSVLYEEDCFMVRAPQIEQRAEVYVDDQFVGYVRPSS